MNLKHLSNETLDQALKTLVQKERETLADILLHIAEVDRRRLHLTFGYPSLFDYLTKHIGYANGSAQRRIDAARLSQDVPTVIADLERGELNLSQVSLVQKSLRAKKKEQSQHSAAAEQCQSNDEAKLALQISKETKTQLLANLKNKSMAESEVLVAQALDMSIQMASTVKHQQDRSVRLELTLTETQWQKIAEMRRLLSNSLPDGSWDQVFEYLADKVIAQKTKSLKLSGGQGLKMVSNEDIAQKAKGKEAKVSKETLNETGDDQDPKNISALAPKIRQLVLHRDQCCQYKSRETGKACGSRWNLEVDHIQPRWAGGTNTAENLRVLCANHNKEIYRQQAGIRRV